MRAKPVNESVLSPKSGKNITADRVKVIEEHKFTVSSILDILSIVSTDDVINPDSMDYEGFLNLSQDSFRDSNQAEHFKVFVEAFNQGKPYRVFIEYMMGQLGLLFYDGYKEKLDLDEVVFYSKQYWEQINENTVLRPKSKDEINRKLEDIFDAITVYLMDYDPEECDDYLETYERVESHSVQIEECLEDNKCSIEQIAHKVYYNEWKSNDDVWDYES